MSRRVAREMALQTLFQMEFSDISIAEALGAVRVEQNKRLSERSLQYAETIIKSILEKKAEIDKMIAGFTKEWDISRLSKVDLLILRIAIEEMYFSTEKVLPGVAINEAVEIAKSFGDDESPRFINGILGKLVRTQGPEEKENVSRA